MRSIVTALCLLGGSTLLAQNPTFEVASIKPAAPQTEGRFMVRMGGDPGRIDYVNVSLRDLIRAAFDVKDFQINGPDWMSSARFDVQAKLPPDTPKEQRSLMFQALLTERFQLKVHKESKEVPVYSLVVGKNGPKMKAAAERPAANPDGPRPAGGPEAGGGARGGRGPDGGPVRPGMMMMRMEGPGKFHLTANATTTANLVELLARQVDKPVFDNTGTHRKVRCRAGVQARKRNG